jgi:hypothetical protein
VGEKSYIPSLAMLANCLLWLDYGFLVGNPNILLTNAVGAMFASYYVYTYSRHCPFETRVFYFSFMSRDPFWSHCLCRTN